MKTIPSFILCTFLLAACSQSPQASIDPPPAIYSSPTPLPQVYSTDDPMLESIRTSFSSGRHAGQFSCEDCHGSSATIGKQLNWLDPADGHTDVVATPTELCLKCHSEQGSGIDTQSQIATAHTNQGCTGCHNAHTTQASCTDSGCHNDIQTIFYAQIVRPEPHPTSGDPSAYMCGGSACHALAEQITSAPIHHQPIHNHVPCFVCHDGSGMTVLKKQDQSWITVPSLTSPAGTDGTPVVSHIISREVNCSKCHYNGNPWGLTEVPTDE
jgi:hypothetical protein